MSSREDYLRELPAIQALPESLARRPIQPVGAYVQEAKNLYQWAQSDRKALEAHGLDWAVVESLPPRAGALHEAESIWSGARGVSRRAAAACRRKEPKVRALRTEVRAILRFAFRHSPEMLAKVTHLPRSPKQCRLIQDLNDFAAYARDNHELIAKAGFDVRKFDKLGSVSARLSRLLALRADDNGDHPSKNTRNRAFWHLKEAVDQVRVVGQFAMRRRADRAKGYASDYLRQVERRRRSAAKAKDSAQTKASA